MAVGGFSGESWISWKARVSVGWEASEWTEEERSRRQGDQAAGEERRRERREEEDARRDAAMADRSAGVLARRRGDGVMAAETKSTERTEKGKIS